jgi:hypothetical protein
MMSSVSNVCFSKHTDKQKVKHSTLDEAISAARKINSRLRVGDFKITAYKCSICHGYHVGTSKTKIDQSFLNKNSRILKTK